jgi:hypothetical protein
LLDHAERDEAIACDPSNTERVLPYLGGDEINTDPTQIYDRFAIDFGQMSEDEAAAWPSLLAIVRARVKPERDTNNRDNYRRLWWQFGEARPGLRKALEPLSRCLVTSIHTKHLAFSFVPAQWIFSHALFVFPFETMTPFAVLQSRSHEAWARLLSSTLEDRAATSRVRYVPTDCFETFPFPQPDPRTVIDSLESIGKQLYDTRAAFMVETDQGLTKTYNALKDPTNTDPRIVELRRLHEQMDRAVLDAYGWTDLAVPPFCPTTPAEQAALASFQDAIIDRLYILNAERAKEEQLLGAADAKGKAKKGAGKKGKKTPAVGQGEMF